MTEIIVNICFLIWIHYFFDEVLDIQFSTRIYDGLNLLQHFFHRHTQTLCQVVQCHATVNGLNNRNLSRRVLCHSAHTQVFWANHIIFFHVFFDYADKLIAITFSFSHTHTWDILHLLQSDRVGCCHCFQTAILEDHKRWYVQALAQLLAQVFQNREQYIICSSARSHTCTQIPVFIFIMHFYRHLKASRAFHKFLTCRGQLQVAV